MEIFQSLAMLGMVLIGFGIIFQVVQPSAFFFFILFLLLLPTVVSLVRGFGTSLLHSNLPWQGWIVLIFAILIGVRVFIDKFFRR